jgi:hypothetical protein
MYHSAVIKQLRLIALRDHVGLSKGPIPKVDPSTD